MELKDVIRLMIMPALAILPPGMNSQQAIVMLLAIGLQESRFKHRRQLPNGPALNFWQFELGTEKSRGGVWGVYLHKASREHLRELCRVRNVDFHPTAIHKASEFDDILAAGLARLLLWTDALRLPLLGDVNGAWVLYADRTWRPGKPHRHTWDAFYAQALKATIEHQQAC